MAAFAPDRTSSRRSRSARRERWSGARSTSASAPWARLALPPHCRSSSGSSTRRWRCAACARSARSGAGRSPIRTDARLATLRQPHLATTRATPLPKCRHVNREQRRARRRWVSSSLELISDRQLSDPLPRRREDGVTQRRRYRRHTRLADAAHRLAVVPRDDVDANVARCCRHARHLVLVEVVLLAAAVLEADLSKHSRGDAHDDRTLHLRAHAVRIHRRATVDCDVDARYREIALVVHLHFDDRRDVAHEAVMRGDAQALALGHGFAPSRFLRHGLGDTPQPPGVHWITLGRLAMIPRVSEHLRRDDPWRTDDLEQIIFRILACGRGAL